MNNGTCNHCGCAAHECECLEIATALVSSIVRAPSANALRTFNKEYKRLSPRKWADIFETERTR